MGLIHVRVLLALIAAVSLASACSSAGPGTSYSIDVTLKSGKPVRCAVNQPAVTVPPSPPLSVKERNEAEVLATQPLRLISGPWSPYPAPETAPRLQCFQISAAKGL